MKMLSIQEVYKKKIERQENIKELQYHASGHCVHIGKLSPGCCACFVPEDYVYNFISGVKCNANCPYCPSDKKAEESTKESIEAVKKSVIQRASSSSNYIPSISFSGLGEPLIYIDIIAEWMKFLYDLEKQTGKKPWYYVYTNGILADNDMILKLRDLGFDEIRFHLGATNFSDSVLKKMENAVRYIKSITVETPAWPPHRKKLFEMLPRIDDVGVKHLHITETEINQFNFDNILQSLPNAEIYQCRDIYLYEGGLIYDIIEEVIRKNYSFSVLDCNSFVKSIQRSPGKLMYAEDLVYDDTLFEGYDRRNYLPQSTDTMDIMNHDFGLASAFDFIASSDE